MKKSSLLYKTFSLYYEGFKNMTIGKTLWVVILVKLFIIFVIVKIFFFPNFIKENADEGHEAEFVSQEVINRVPNK